MEQLRLPKHIPARSRVQSGMVLFVTLVVLVLVTIATISVVRSMDTSTLVSGNFAFKQAAMQSSDRAITDAINNLSALVAGGGGNNDQSNRYSAVRLTPVDALGVPTAITWTGVPCADEDNASCDPAVDNGKYRIQYFIERQCSASPNLADSADIKAKCEYEVRQASPEQLAIRYRVIVRVQGPRNATGMYEVVVSGPPTI